jgi:hypothetical protein
MPEKDKRPLGLWIQMKSLSCLPREPCHGPTVPAAEDFRSPIGIHDSRASGINSFYR